uniref:UPAR/Ly6 domain-containing protein n=1 Tax=Terrapene triunguis TaxID=2587831 RepID=A0A674HWZ6_9SAUR
MRHAILFLLAAQSLRCYTCREPTDLSACTSVSNCSANDTACKTTVLSVDSGYPFFGNITVSKSCVKTCVPTDPDGIGESHPDSCCYTDLCNTGGHVELTLAEDISPVNCGFFFFKPGI